MGFSTFIDSLSVKSGLVASLAILALGGCIGTSYPYMRTETAQRIAAPAWMIKRDISADPFLLRAYERIHDRGGIAHIYIEGESSDALTDATPFNPVALHLASKDKADNVIYIARPCQYTGMISPAKKCDSRYWEAEQFSQTVLESYNKALDDIALRYDIRSFNLIGFSGGATIATLLAAQREDVASLRTVAGILDIEAYAQQSQTTSLDGSVNPVSQITTLAKVPQYHFVGGHDDIVPPAILHSYLQSMPPSTCVQTMLIQEAEHAAGWVDKWPELLELPVSCYEQNAVYSNEGNKDSNEGNDSAETIMTPTMPQDLPFTVRETSAKP
ncbi:MAG: hypothetical protein KAJ40_05400 [Alphaproteobacteria bacterium]|nr:hypothetical protein [Alphaproteobacteria bacterium]